MRFTRRFPSRAVALLTLASVVAACGATTNTAPDAADGTDATRDTATGLDAPTNIDGASDDGTTSGDDATIVDDVSDSAIAGDGSSGSDSGVNPLPTQPNIVVIMADDLDLGGFNRLLSTGHLPHIASAIADDGLVFDNYFAANPLCCPSRASFLAGQYSHNTGVHNNGEDDETGTAPASPEGGIGAFDDRSTIATWLHAAGYRTALVGKYLNGYGNSLPSYYNGPQTAARYVPPGWDDWHALQRGTYNMYSYQFNENGTVSRDYTMYQTDKLADVAVQVINDASTGAAARHPLYLEVTTVAPHIELPTPAAFVGQTGGAIRPPPRYQGMITWALPSPPSLNEGDVSDKPGWVQLRNQFTAAQLAEIRNLYQQRMEAMMGVDDLVGRVVAALRSNGRLQDTVLVFMSDNGYLLGQHRVMGKMNPYEESIRIPLVMHVPGNTAQRHVSNFVLNSDLAPTFAALAGATIPASYAVDGRSIAPLLMGRNPAQWRNRIAIEHYQEPNGSSMPDYRGLRSTPDAPMYRDRMFALYPAAGRREIYDLGADPFELDSFQDRANAATELSVTQTLAGDLHRCVGPMCRSLEDQ